MFVRQWMLKGLLFLSLVLILSACGDDGEAKDNTSNNNENTEEKADETKIGLNKITLDEMVTKKDNNEAFYMLLVNVPKGEVKQTKLFEAYDKALKEKKILAYYINIHDFNYEENQVIKSLNEEYENRKYGHSPFEFGGMIVIHHNVIDYPYNYFDESGISNNQIGILKSEGQNFLKDEHYKNNILKDIQLGIDFVKEEKIKVLQ